MGNLLVHYTDPSGLRVIEGDEGFGVYHSDGPAYFHSPDLPTAQDWCERVGRLVVAVGLERVRRDVHQGLSRLKDNGLVRGNWSWSPDGVVTMRA